MRSISGRIIPGFLEVYARDFLDSLVNFQDLTGYMNAQVKYNVVASQND